MSGRKFGPAGFGALTVDQLLITIRYHPEYVLRRLCEELDNLRAEQVRALAIQNMYRSEEWRADLWYLGPNQEHVPYDAQVNLTRHREQQLALSREGIGRSILRENHLGMLIARVERLCSYWAELVDHLGSF